MKEKIKILTGWSNAGGSTVSFINLCNLLNERGYDCTLYGPHAWHIGKCKSGWLNECPLNEVGERLIVHFLKIPARPTESEAVVLACHERPHWFNIKETECFWDETVFVSEGQKKDQGTEGIIIPNVVTGLSPNKVVVLGKPAGIIGSIDQHKNTHVSIERAIKDGHKEILLYGLVTEQDYYEKHVKSYVEDGTVTIKGHEDDKQKMYDSISCAYQSSKGETFNLIKAECKLTETPYHGLPSAESGADQSWTKSEILNAWKTALNLS
jgi:hypothetical protein